jgi:hypothetical protein
MARPITDDLELHIGPHCARRGWETVRLHYNAANPRHLREIEAALGALRGARLGLGDEAKLDERQQ